MKKHRELIFILAGLIIVFAPAIALWAMGYDFRDSVLMAIIPAFIMNYVRTSIDIEEIKVTQKRHLNMIGTLTDNDEMTLNILNKISPPK